MPEFLQALGIGGYPFITRFKTARATFFGDIQSWYWRLSIYNKV